MDVTPPLPQPRAATTNEVTLSTGVSGLAGVGEGGAAGATSAEVKSSNNSVSVARQGVGLGLFTPEAEHLLFSPESSKSLDSLFKNRLFFTFRYKNKHVESAYLMHACDQHKTIRLTICATFVGVSCIFGAFVLGYAISGHWSGYVMIILGLIHLAIAVANYLFCYKVLSLGYQEALKKQEEEEKEKLRKSESNKGGGTSSSASSVNGLTSTLRSSGGAVNDEEITTNFSFDGVGGAGDRSDSQFTGVNPGSDISHLPGGLVAIPSSGPTAPSDGATASTMPLRRASGRRQYVTGSLPPVSEQDEQHLAKAAATMGSRSDGGSLHFTGIGASTRVPGAAVAAGRGSNNMNAPGGVGIDGDISTTVGGHQQPAAAPGGMVGGMGDAKSASSDGDEKNNKTYASPRTRAWMERKKTAIFRHELLYHLEMIFGACTAILVYPHAHYCMQMEMSKLGARDTYFHCVGNIYPWTIFIQAIPYVAQFARANLCWPQVALIPVLMFVPRIWYKDNLEDSMDVGMKTTVHGLLALIWVFVIHVTAWTRRTNFESYVRSKRATLRLEQQFAVCTSTLDVVLPPSTMEQLRRGEKPIDFSHQCSVIVCSVHRFREWCYDQLPAEVVQTLDTMYSLFDSRCFELFGVRKVKTSGDLYISAHNLIEEVVAETSSPTGTPNASLRASIMVVYDSSPAILAAKWMVLMARKFSSLLKMRIEQQERENEEWRRQHRPAHQKTPPGHRGGGIVMADAGRSGSPPLTLAPARRRRKKGGADPTKEEPSPAKRNGSPQRRGGGPFSTAANGSSQNPNSRAPTLQFGMKAAIHTGSCQGGLQGSDKLWYEISGEASSVALDLVKGIQHSGEVRVTQEVVTASCGKFEGACPQQIYLPTLGRETVAFSVKEKEAVIKHMPAPSLPPHFPFSAPPLPMPSFEPADAKKTRDNNLLQQQQQGHPPPSADQHQLPSFEQQPTAADQQHRSVAGDALPRMMETSTKTQSAPPVPSPNPAEKRRFILEQVSGGKLDPDTFFGFAEAQALLQSLTPEANRTSDQNNANESNSKRKKLESSLEGNEGPQSVTRGKEGMTAVVQMDQSPAENEGGVPPAANKPQNRRDSTARYGAKTESTNSSATGGVSSNKLSATETDSGSSRSNTSPKVSSRRVNISLTFAPTAERQYQRDTAVDRSLTGNFVGLALMIAIMIYLSHVPEEHNTESDVGFSLAFVVAVLYPLYLIATGGFKFPCSEEEGRGESRPTTNEGISSTASPPNTGGVSENNREGRTAEQIFTFEEEDEDQGDAEKEEDDTTDDLASVGKKRKVRPVHPLLDFLVIFWCWSCVWYSLSMMEKGVFNAHPAYMAIIAICHASVSLARNSAIVQSIAIVIIFLESMACEFYLRGVYGVMTRFTLIWIFVIILVGNTYWTERQRRQTYKEERTLNALLEAVQNELQLFRMLLNKVVQTNVVDIVIAKSAQLRSPLVNSLGEVCTAAVRVDFIAPNVFASIPSETGVSTGGSSSLMTSSTGPSSRSPMTSGIQACPHAAASIATSGKSGAKPPPDHFVKNLIAIPSAEGPTTNTHGRPGASSSSSGLPWDNLANVTSGLESFLSMAVDMAADFWVEALHPATTSDLGLKSTLKKGLLDELELNPIIERMTVMGDQFLFAGPLREKKTFELPPKSNISAADAHGGQHHYVHNNVPSAPRSELCVAQSKDVQEDLVSLASTAFYYFALFLKEWTTSSGGALMSCVLHSGSAFAAVVGTSRPTFTLLGPAIRGQDVLLQAAPPGFVGMSDKFHFIFRNRMQEHFRKRRENFHQEEEQQQQQEVRSSERREAPQATPVNTSTGNNDNASADVATSTRLFAPGSWVLHGILPTQIGATDLEKGIIPDEAFPPPAVTPLRNLDDLMPPAAPLEEIVVAEPEQPEKLSENPPAAMRVGASTPPAGPLVVAGGSEVPPPPPESPSNPVPDAFYNSSDQEDPVPAHAYPRTPPSNPLSEEDDDDSDPNPFLPGGPIKRRRRKSDNNGGKNESNDYEDPSILLARQELEEKERRKMEKKMVQLFPLTSQQEEKLQRLWKVKGAGVVSMYEISSSSSQGYPREK